MPAGHLGVCVLNVQATHFILAAMTLETLKLERLRALGRQSLPVPVMTTDEPASNIFFNANILTLAPAHTHSTAGVTFHGVRASLQVDTLSAVEGHDGRLQYEAQIGNRHPRLFASVTQFNPTVHHDLQSYMRVHQRTLYTSRLLEEFKAELLRAEGLSESEVNVIQSLKVRHSLLFHLRVLFNSKLERCQSSLYFLLYISRQLTYMFMLASLGDGQPHCRTRSPLDPPRVFKTLFHPHSST